MENFFSVSQTAEMVGMTAETLRHYDRIGLVRPNRTDEWTGYRYYTEQEVVMLRIVRALRCMELPLEEIRRLLQSDDLSETAAFLKDAEAQADEKIAQLLDAKARIGRARAYYERKAAEFAEHEGAFFRDYPERVVLLATALQTPTMENLYDYHRHFYAQVGRERRGDFAFADTAGVYEREGNAHMFALCERYAQTDGLVVLPAGRYLCADCTEETLSETLRALKERAAKDAAPPAFTLRFIVISGIARWRYRLEVPYLQK